MTLRIFLRPAAFADFDDAAAWYERQRAGLGSEFVEEIQKAFDAIAAQPEKFPIAIDDIREAPVSRFPYCVYYRVKPTRIVIIAVFHTARDPSIWQSRS